MRQTECERHHFVAQFRLKRRNVGGPSFVALRRCWTWPSPNGFGRPLQGLISAAVNISPFECDRNSLAGIVRAHEAARTSGVRLVVGCRLDLADGMSVLVYPTDRPAYARLCRLLSLGKKRAGKGKCHLEWPDFVAYGEGLIAIVVPDAADETCVSHLLRLREAFAGRAYMALTLRRWPNDRLRLWELSSLGAFGLLLSLPISSSAHRATSPSTRAALS